MNDMVNHPAHYTQFKYEVIELTRLLPFSLGNFVKYVIRAPFKGHFEQDLQKAVWYLRDAQQHVTYHSGIVVDKRILEYANYFSDLVASHDVYNSVPNRAVFAKCIITVVESFITNQRVTCPNELLKLLNND